MRVEIDIDEWYPVYTLEQTNSDRYAVEVPDDLVKRHRAALAEFEAVQNEIRALHRKASA